MRRRPSTTRERWLGYCFAWIGPLLYLGFTSSTVVYALQTRGETALQAQEMKALTRRVESLESVHVEREIALLSQGQNVLDSKLDVIVKLGLLVVTGVVLNLGLSVFRLTMQVKLSARGPGGVDG